MEPYFQETVPQSTFTIDDAGRKSMAKAVKESGNGVSGGFDCNICLDTVRDPVVTLCGHLFCWPCIYKWIYHQNTSSENPENQNPRCPVCKTEVSQKTIVPLYGRGKTMKPGTGEKAPRVGMVIPLRPHTPRYGVVGTRAQQVNHGGYQQRAPPLLATPDRGGMSMTTAISPSPTILMLGEMLSGRILGDLGTPLFAATPNSYNFSWISTRQARRQAMQADRSLSRIYIFLFCCIILCLLLFS